MLERSVRHVGSRCDRYRYPGAEQSGVIGVIQSDGEQNSCGKRVIVPDSEDRADARAAVKETTSIRNSRRRTKIRAMCIDRYPAVQSKARTQRVLRRRLESTGPECHHEYNYQMFHCTTSIERVERTVGV